VLLAVFCSLTFAADPALDLSEEADLQFELGVGAYQRRDYEGALEHLLASNRLVPNRNVVFNIARAYEQLGRYAEAFRHYADYRSLETDPARQAGADDALARIRPRVALVRVESDPPGARIFVDRKDLGSRGETPRLLALDPGSHTILLTREGHYEARSENVSLVVGRETSVRLDMEPVLGQVKLQGRPEGASVRIDAEDGAVVGTLPGQLALGPGSHMLIVSAPGYRTARQLVQVTEDAEVLAVVELPLITGTLVVDALERGALIEVDGEAAGFTPAVLPAVPAGTHHLKLSLPGYRAFEAEIDVEPDGRVAVTASLRPVQEVTAASRQRQAVENAPASVTILSSQELRAFGYATLYDALGGTRGVFQANDRVYESIGIRGFARPGDYGNRLLLTLDGHSLNDDLLGGSYVGTDVLPSLHDVDRIEVVRGPGSALYGSNAFFGVVNVVTRERESTRPSHVSVSTTAPAGAHARASASGNLGKSDGWWLSADGLFSQGDPPYAEPGGGVTSTEAAWADASTGAGARGKLWAGDFTLVAYGNHRDKRIPTGAYATLPSSPLAHSADTRGFVEARFEPRFGKATQLFTRAWVDRYDFAGEYPYEDGENAPIVVSDSWHGTWLGAEARLAARPAPWFGVTVGAAGNARLQAELRGEEGGDAYLSESPTSQDGGVYAVIDADAGRALSASVGGRLDVFSAVDPSFNPRASLILRPAENHTVKLLAGRAFRAPSPYELFYNDDGTTQVAPEKLAPESVLTGEVEYTARFGEVGAAVASVYYNEVEGLIGLEENADGLLVYANSDATVATGGVEVELRRDWRGGWMVALVPAWQRAREVDLLGTDELTNTPEFLASLKAAAPLLPGQVNGATRVCFETGRLDDEGGRTEPAVLWDLTLTGAVPSLRLDWTLGVRNLLDWDVRWPTGGDTVEPTVPQPGRSLYADATVAF
jgi:outer membrane receptor protein involved in Fe transport